MPIPVRCRTQPPERPEQHDRIRSSKGVFMQILKKISALYSKVGKKPLFAAAGVVLCAAAVGAVLIFRGPSKDSEVTADESSSQASQTQEKSVIEKTGQKLMFIDFKKAPLSEYDMAQTHISSAQPEETEQEEEDESDPSAFKVKVNAREFTYSDVKNSAARLSATRDISKEFYTVRDITTGKPVTMNGYQLICAIVYNEVGDGWGAEAIKAQAVAAYSCLRYMDSIGMIETVGIKTNYTAKIESCVRAVQGQVVTYGGGIANTLYSASTSGYTLPSNLAIVSSYPYLKSVKSAYDSEDPNWGLKSSFTKEAVKSKLEKQFGVKLSDDVKKWFELTDVRYGKYVFGVSIDGKKTVTGKAIADLFGLRSRAFEISFSNGKFFFTSYGWGHGVGMSQWGACMYARHGYTYDQILTHYYVNTKLKLSSVSTKAVARGKMSQAELDREAEKATETTTLNDDVIPPDNEQTESGGGSTDPDQSKPLATTTTKSSQDTEDTQSTEPEGPDKPGETVTSAAEQPENGSGDQTTSTADNAE